MSPVWWCARSGHPLMAFMMREDGYLGGRMNVAGKLPCRPGKNP